MKKIKYYSDLMFKVEYEFDGNVLKFKVWRIIALHDQNIEDSEIDDEIEIEGWIRECMEFKQESHYCCKEHAKDVCSLLCKIFDIKEGLIII